MDIVETIVQYLTTNRRLVVPSFGAFIVKNDDEVLFSELLNTDDGVLRGLLIARGLSELAAVGAIDRFVFDARYALSETGRFEVGTLGTIVSERGVLKLVRTGSRASAATIVTPTQRRTVAAEQSNPTAKHAVKARRRGTDWFMIVAIVVVLCAVAAIVYGYFCSAAQGEQDEAMMDMLRFRAEQPAASDK
ncbi:MAG: hypothetical protein ACI35T_02090 [Alistipes sp.]